MADFSSLTKAETAEAFGVTLPTIEAWIRKGMPAKKRGNRWCINLADALAWRIEDLTGYVISVSLDTAKTRLATEQADKIEMENAQTRGELVNVDDAAAVIECVVVAIRAKALSLGSKLAPQVVVCSNVNEVKALIDAGAESFLREIAEINPAGARGSVQRDPVEAPAGAAPAEVVRQRVGRRKPRPVARKQRRARKLGDRKG